jgi:CheY-like chemotaxis protein
MRILWLDDEAWILRREAESLRDQGHSVMVVSSEEAALAHLERGPLPDVLIQDLLRPASYAQVPHGRRRRESGDITQSGWRFYEDVLKPHFPQLPVVICTADAHRHRNRKLADDFNLLLVAKHDIILEVGQLIDKVRANHSLFAHSVPGVVALDFGRVNTALLRHLASHPTDLHRVNWVTFEELVARLLQEMGWQVQRTPLTRDKGVDIWAFQSTALGEVCYAIDAKKYAPDSIVGPEPVRAIHGVADLEGATAGVIVTTGRFGPEARRLSHQYRYRIGLREYADVIEWIERVRDNV